MNDQSPDDKFVALPDDFIGPPFTDLEKPVRKTATKTKLVTTATLTSTTCRWPIGDPAEVDFHYCGQPPPLGQTYCDTHDALSRPPTARKKS